MKKEQWNEALNVIDDSLVEEFLQQSKMLEKEKKKRTLLVRTTALAACVCLVFGAVLFSFRYSASKIPTWGATAYSAQDVATLFSGSQASLDEGTNAYTKVYLPVGEVPTVGEIPNTKYGKIFQYRAESVKSEKKELEKFVEPILPKVAGALGFDELYFNDDDSLYHDEVNLTAKIDDYYISAGQNKRQTVFSITSLAENQRILWNGTALQIDQRCTDEEIIMSVGKIKNELFDIFGVSFDDAKVVREYVGWSSQSAASNLSIYFYNKEEHSLNETQRAPVSDCVRLNFKNHSGRSHDLLSDSIIYADSISYNKQNAQYEVIAKAKRISLEQAETYLYKGYVFGGHSCPHCMEEQEYISFQDYNYVGIEYVFGIDEENDYLPTVGIPFYAFYKVIDMLENGNTIYAKTYVPAIEIDGYDAYFQDLAEQYHNN